jgi:hypothetical protein
MSISDIKSEQEFIEKWTMYFNSLQYIPEVQKNLILLGEQIKAHPLFTERASIEEKKSVEDSHDFMKNNPYKDFTTIKIPVEPPVIDVPPPSPPDVAHGIVKPT